MRRRVAPSSGAERHLTTKRAARQRVGAAVGWESDGGSLREIHEE
jgi:hypothetical protein